MVPTHHRVSMTSLSSPVLLLFMKIGLENIKMDMEAQLSKESNARNFSIPDFKLYYRATVIKTA